MKKLYSRLASLGMISVTLLIAWIYCIIEYNNKFIYITTASIILICSLFLFVKAAISLHNHNQQALYKHISDSISSLFSDLNKNKDIELKLSKASYIQSRKAYALIAKLVDDLLQSQLDIKNNIIHTLSDIEESAHDNTNLLVNTANANSTDTVNYLKELLATTDANNQKLLDMLQTLNSSISGISNYNLVNTDDAKTDVTSNNEAPTEIVTDNVNENIIPFPSEPSAEASISLPVVDDPNRPMSPEEIAALFASSANKYSDSDTSINTDLEAEELTNSASESIFDADEEQYNSSESSIFDFEPNKKEENTISTVSSSTNSDSNKMMTPEEIEALFAAAIPKE